MNQLAIVDRGAAARKAWETRRSRGMIPTNPIAAAFAAGPTPKEMALYAWEEAVKASESGGMPDWHRAAYALKAALTGDREWQASKAHVLRQARPTALPAPAWPDYPVDHLSAFKVRNPTIVVSFADGEVVRAPAVSAKDKPINIGRALRVAIAYYQARICHRKHVRFAPGYFVAVPAITAAACEETGETFDAKLCTAKTLEARKAQDWRLRHDRRRIESHTAADR